MPQSPPLGVPTPTGLADYGKFVRDARAAEGDAALPQSEAPNANEAQLAQLAQAGKPIPPRAPLTRSDKPIGADDPNPVPTMESIGRDGKPSEDDRKRHEVFVRASRQLPGAGPRELEVLRHIYMTEGGDHIDPSRTKASSGVIASTFEAMKKSGKFPDLKDVKEPGDIPTDRRPEVMREYLNGALAKAGGSAALERFEDQTVANSVASAVFYQGAYGGGTAVRQALKETVKDDPSPGMSKIRDDGTITTELLDELTPVLKDPAKRDTFLENLANARIPILEKAVGKQPGGLTDAETRAINDYRPSRARR